MDGIAMGLKCPVCAAEDRADSNEDESARSDNNADGGFQAHPSGRRAFWPPSAARPLGVPSVSGTPSSPLLEECQKSGRRNPAITGTDSWSLQV